MIDQSLIYSTEIEADPNRGKNDEWWVKLLPANYPIRYRGREVEFSSDDLKGIVRNFTMANAHFESLAMSFGDAPAFNFPILAEHKREGQRFGEVKDLKFAKKQGFEGIWGKLKWNTRTLEAVEAGDVRHVSMRYDPEYTAEDGKKFGPIITEVSITSEPFLKVIGDVQHTRELTLSQQLATELEALDMEPEALFEMIKEAVREGMAEAVDQPEEEPAEEEAEMSQEDTKPEVEASVEAAEEEPVEASEEVEEATEEEPVIEASQEAQEEPVEALALSAIESLIQPLKDEIESLKSRPSVRLNTQEQGRQGDPPTAPVELSYEDRLKRIQEREGCNRSKAIELELMQSH